MLSLSNGEKLLSLSNGEKLLSLSNGEKSLVAEHLEKLGHGEAKPLNKRDGISHELYAKGLIKSDRWAVGFVMKYAEGWPKHSGFCLSPVHFPGWDVLGLTVGEESFWPDSQFSDDWRELCLFIAAKLRNEIKGG